MSLLCAQNFEKGKTPSFAISCLTACNPWSIHTLPVRRPSHTSGCCEGHNHNIANDGQSDHAGHDAWGGIVAKDLAEEQCRHVELSINLVTEGYDAQLEQD